ncbi:unnamed protein product [Gordionus sp. m RMFG-2023]|uniref:succinate dehydrogenase [ubiquinone] cytochrome b small subunit, mitochondrial-like n=1 Tax=Gordionus sp. m RMFG-2023 TaxID=3053472 RepID=UPI0030E028EE
MIGIRSYHTRLLTQRFQMVSRYSYKLQNSLTFKYKHIESVTNNILISKPSDIDSKYHESLHWSIERYLVMALYGIFPASYFISHPCMDYLLASSIVLHGHWGMEVVMSDYVDRWDRYNRYNFFGKMANMSVLSVSATTLGLLFYFNYTDVGLIKAISLLWHL